MLDARKVNTLSVPARFLDPGQLLESVPVRPGMVIADFGSGNGYYAVTSGQLAGNKGRVIALDIMEEALSQTATLAKLLQVHNVATQVCDLERFGSCQVEDTSCDLVIIGSLLHQVENRDNVIREAYRVLKTSGQILVVEWKETSPFGPPSVERVRESSVRGLLEKYGFRPERPLDAGSFHYAFLYQK